MDHDDQTRNFEQAKFRSFDGGISINAHFCSRKSINRLCKKFANTIKKIRGQTTDFLFCSCLFYQKIVQYTA